MNTGNKKESPPELSLSEIAVQLRKDLNRFLPDSMDTTVLASEDATVKGITVTVTKWPRSIPMLSHEHIFAERRAVLSGQIFEMSYILHPSDEAKLVAAQIENLIAHYQTVKYDPVADLYVRNFVGEVAFDKRELDAELTEILQSLKTSSVQPKGRVISR